MSRPAILELPQERKELNETVIASSHDSLDLSSDQEEVFFDADLAAPEEISLENSTLEEVVILEVVKEPCTEGEIRADLVRLSNFFLNCPQQEKRNEKASIEKMLRLLNTNADISSIRRQSQTFLNSMKAINTTKKIEKDDDFLSNLDQLSKLVKEINN